jgi:hypothetical protein
MKKKFSKAGYKERVKVTEKAAEAISFFLTVRLTSFTIIEETCFGTGVDYWLGYNEQHPLYNPKNFFNARLEVSGIFRETTENTLEKRIHKKKAQTSLSDGTQLPAYISVIEFSSPKAYFGKK